LTLRGAECLRAADVVLYDYLANSQVLAHAQPAALLVCLGRHGHGRLMTQEEVNATMIRHAREGRTVVRLKGGDPTIFARAGEELAALEEADVPYEIVPGVTAAQAASSHAGIPLTDRDDASCVAFVTGQERRGKGSQERLDYDALARFPGTLVFYMGVTTAGEWSEALMAHGKSRKTPVAIVRHGSLPNQQTIHTTLQDVGALVQQSAKLRPPAVIVVGEVARKRDVANWFTSRPLFGRTVLVTRPGHVAELIQPGQDEVSARLRASGARVLHQPAILIGPPADWGPVDAAIQRLDEFDWLVFTSANGVEYFMLRLITLGHDARRLGGLQLAVIGGATEEALLQCCLSADVCPEVARAETLAEELAPVAAGKRFLLARGSRGREVLADMLSGAGGRVEQVVVYSSADVETADAEIAAAMAKGEIYWTTVTSSAIARNLVRLFGSALRQTRLIAISPLTAETLREAGYEPAAVADEYNAAGVVATILAAEHGAAGAKM
jgi:uroporphyrinogen III methyltransferase/synthase